jgi:arylsulfatase
MPFDSMMYIRWYGDLMWLFVPVGGQVKQFFSTIPGYPFQAGASMNPSNINYNTLKAAEAMKRLQEIETLSNPHN